MALTAGLATRSAYGAAARASAPPLVGNWPQHALLAVDQRNSWDAHLVAKTVLERRSLDELLSPIAWSTRAPATVEALHKASIAVRPGLRLEAPMLDPILLQRQRQANGKIFGTSYVRDGGGAVYWRYHFARTQDWTRFNRIRLRIRPHETGLSSYRLVMALVSGDAGRNPSDPLPFHFLPGLKAGKWNDVIWEFDELARGKVSQLAILLPLVGPLGREARYDIAEVTLERVEPEPIAGWAVAEGRIALNQVGYTPAATKVALARPGGAVFEIRDASSGDLLERKPARIVQTRIGRFAELDFSDFERLGAVNLSYGNVRSAEFVIDNGRTAAIVGPLLNFLYADRCGHSVAGVHGVCHTELYAEHQGVRKAINGGWHDAGNLCQGAYRTTLVTEALFDAHERLGPSLPPVMRARLLEEACWGLDWLLATRFGNGVRVVNSSFTYMQDGRSGSGDEIIVSADSAAFESFLFAAAALKASRRLASVDPIRASRARAAAIEDHQAAVAGLPDDLTKLPEGANLPAPHEVLAAAVLSSLSLTKASGGPAHLSQALKFADRLLAHQEMGLSNAAGITGYWNRDVRGERRVLEVHTSFGELPALALAAMIEALPNHPDRSRWHAAIAIESECFLSRGAEQVAPFRHVPTAVWKTADVEPYIARAVGQLPFAKLFGAPDIVPLPDAGSIRAALDVELSTSLSVAKGEWLRTFPIGEDQVFHGAGTIQLARAIALAKAAGVRSSIRSEYLARRQLDWHLGVNPFAASLIYGVGEGYASNMLQWADDLVGATQVGMDSKGDAPFWPHTCHMTSREVWVVPAARMLSLLSALLPEGAARWPLSLKATEAGDSVVVQVVGPRDLFAGAVMTGFNVDRIEPIRANGAASGTWRLRVKDTGRPWVAILMREGRALADYVGPTS